MDFGLINEKSPTYFADSFTRVVSAGDGNVAYTGIGFRPKFVQFVYAMDNTISFGQGWIDGTNQSFRKNNRAGVADDISISQGFAISITTLDGGNTIQSASFVSFDSDGFTLDWAESGSPTGTLEVNFVAYR